jgi:phosphate-selective porin OprO/OprP
MKKYLSLLVALLILSTSATFAQQVIDSKFGKGVNVIASDSSFSMKFNARVQSLMMFETDMDELSSNWLIRRSRLKFSGFAYSPKVKYKIELGLSNRDHGGEDDHTNNTSNLILDAFVSWNFYKNMEVWIGQTKLPGNRERVISSQKLQFVDRSLLNSRFNIDRDMGIQFRNKATFGSVVTRQALAISQGEGRNRTDGNQGGYEYTGRLEVLPLGEFTSKGDYFGADLKREAKPKIAFGITYDVNNNAARERGNLGGYVVDTAQNTLNTLFADVMLKYRGFSLMGEIATKEAVGERLMDENQFVSNYYTGTGVNIQAGYLFTNDFETAIRYTSITPEFESRRDLQEMLTFGLSRYIRGHSLKVQTDFSIITETDNWSGSEGDAVSTEYMFRFQVEMAF